MTYETRIEPGGSNVSTIRRQIEYLKDRISQFEQDPYNKLRRLDLRDACMDTICDFRILSRSSPSRQATFWEIGE